MNTFLYRAAFAVGLLAVGWVAAGYLSANPLALAMTALILAFYLMGARELQRFQQASAALERALAEVPAPLARLDDWLDRVPAALRHAVRLRVEGELNALPGPALTPYLAGLLVLLGMLGTFLGMVVTLKGTGAALQSATDLPSMRESLAAPVRGLGLAFGTSVAGVAASAMLGLMSALCRRERLQVAQRLDAQAAGALRVFGRAHQREQALALQQQQAQLMPVLVDRLQALMTRLDEQARQAHDRQFASQERFQAQAEASYRALAASVDRSLQHSLGEAARTAAATLQPAAEATMAGIAREAGALHARVGEQLQQQLDGLTTRFAAGTDALAERWSAALAGHGQASEDLARRLGASLDGTAQQIAAGWQQALLRQEQAGVELTQQTRQSLDAAAAQFEQQAAALLGALGQSQQTLHDGLAARDAQRLAAWTGALGTLATALQREWQQAGEHSLGQQAQICRTLEHTAERIAAQAEAHARATIAEIGRLVQAASEAPRAAADLVARLREQLSDSLARDTAMLDERQRVMAALNGLLDSVQRTAAEQQQGIAQLVAATAGWLDQAGARLDARIDAEAARMDGVAAQLRGSAVELASLGEAFGAGVELFSQSSSQLMTHLQRVDDTLGQAMARSDEQLAYYVAQARELIDLSLLSQKQIIEDLQRVAGGLRAAQDSEA